MELWIGVKKMPTSSKGKSIEKGMEMGKCERSGGNTVGIYGLGAKLLLW